MLKFCLVYFTIQMSVYGVVFYLPTRIASFLDGQVGLNVGLITAIPWVCALVVTRLVTRQADRSGQHRQLAVACWAWPQPVSPPRRWPATWLGR